MRYFIKTTDRSIIYKAVGAKNKIEITKWADKYDPIEIHTSDPDNEADGFMEIPRYMFLPVYETAMCMESVRLNNISIIMKEADNA